MGTRVVIEVMYVLLMLLFLYRSDAMLYGRPGIIDRYHCAVDHGRLF